MLEPEKGPNVEPVDPFWVKWLQNISSILRHDVQVLSLTNSKILAFCFIWAVYNWFTGTMTILSSLERGKQFGKGMDCICMICWHKHFHWDMKIKQI